MTTWQRITREPALITSAIRAGLYCAVLFGLPLTDEQTAGVLLAVEAVLALVTRAVVAPAAEVVVQQVPGDTVQTAGPASDVETGAPVYAKVTKILGKA
jgi:hypothetical protein